MSMRRLSAIAACVGVLGLLLAGCTPAGAPATPPKQAAAVQATVPAAAPTPATKAAQGPKYGGILEMPAESAPADLDGLWATSIEAQIFINPSYNGLLQYDPLENTKIVPRLAERWEISADGNLITFHLRKGVKWHDGKAFNAHDVKATMDLWQTPPAGKVFLGGPLKHLTRNVEVTDEYTVKVGLERRSNIYVGLLAAGNIGTIGPKHILDAQKGLMRNMVVGTGPFKFKKYEAGVVYEAVKNADYFIDGRPYLDGLKVYVIKDRSTMVAALRSGRIKVTWISPSPISASQAKTIQDTMPQAEILMNVPAVESWYFNNSRPPWNDKRVRQAVHLATDRQAATGALSEGVGFAGSHLPEGPFTMSRTELMDKPGYRQPKDQDITEAKRLLAEAGYPNGFRSTVLVRGGSKVYEDRAIFAKDQVAKIGIDLRIDIRDYAVWQRLRRDRDFDSLVLSVVYYVEDPLGALTYFGPGNDFNFEGGKRDELMMKYDTASTDPERRNAGRELEQFMMDEQPCIIFVWKPRLMAYWKEIRNMKLASGLYNNNTYEAVYIDR